MTRKKDGRRFTRTLRAIAAAAGLAALAIMATARNAPRSPVTRIAIAHELSRLDGSHLSVQAVEVTYGPGGASSPHSHPCPVVVYVLEGAVRTRVHGEAEKVYRAGESFYEAPHGVHEVSANASDTSPAKFLAYFVCDHETALSVPENGSKREAEGDE